MAPEGRRSDRDGERRFQEEPPFIVNGWTIYAYPDFRERYAALLADFRRVRMRDPAGYRKSSAAKVLFAVRRLLLHEIPTDPGADKFRQGRTLGQQYRYWRRAKFFERFRLFFRYHSESRIIVVVWLNDESTLRRSGGRSDPYYVFHAMLERGKPPSKWLDLLNASSPMDASQLGGSEDDADAM